MKAVILTQPGGVENLQIQEIAVPVPADNEVLVSVKAISINPVDAFVRGNGNFLKHVLHLKDNETPVILGWDIAGEVTETGKSVTRFKKGDQVFGMVNFEGHGKAYAEYVAAPQEHLAIKPASATHEEAAAATLAAITAWQALVTYGKIKKGDKILIHAAAGGVGHYAVQIAKHFGAYVVGTSSADNKDFVLGLGADEHIDYATQKFEELVSDADLVLDSLGIPGHLDRSLASLKKGGRLISILAHFTDPALIQQIEDKPVFTHRVGVTTNGGNINDVAALIEKGVLRSHVSKVYGFNDIPAAHEQIITGRTKGKIVISL